MPSVNLMIADTDYQFTKSATDKTQETRITTGLATGAADKTEDLNTRIGPAYLVELSGSQNTLPNRLPASEPEMRVAAATAAAEAAPLIHLQTAQQAGIAALAQSATAPQALVSQLKD
ncbi:hypothetical protein [Sporomusa termitida]|uniref:Flagellin C-terminal domain-containing protein n=1 Tax=Sporomusa termitida TaxID=2377 RepID=A0A517DPV4_9FIRM|nr:hypothetical protein [Sporomusa termitida]QDR79394.1 hypothetical protein SPTER_06680 [Sporomusa termitida]